MPTTTKMAIAITHKSFYNHVIHLGHTCRYGLGKVHDKLVTQLQGMEDLPPPPEEPGDNETTPTLAATPTAAEIATYVQFTDWMYRYYNTGWSHDLQPIKSLYSSINSTIRMV